VIRVICVGKKHESMYEQAIAHFEERLKHYTKLSWLILPHSPGEGNLAKKEESKKILDSIKSSEFVILLDEKGSNLTTPELATIIDRSQYSSQDICIVIGGAYGVDDTVSSRANSTLSYGKAVFPHQLIRLMVTEQLYRAYSILAGSSYHHS
jgi:23S rRNA (pseudouridine1915-N3)-methyltransferase